jgi:hypothetical protein
MTANSPQFNVTNGSASDAPKSPTPRVMQDHPSCTEHQPSNRATTIVPGRRLIAGAWRFTGDRRIRAIRLCYCHFSLKAGVSVHAGPPAETPRRPNRRLNSTHFKRLAFLADPPTTRPTAACAR